MRELIEETIQPIDQQKITSLEEEVERLRAELAEARIRVQTLTELADTDPLVEIMNRRAFIREMSRLMASVERHNVIASLVYVDLNNLKNVNDNHGHSAGDAVLKYIGETLATQTRQTDTVGRLGGDEFGLLLAHADSENAMMKMANIANIIASKPMIWQNCALNISISFGIYTLDPNMNIQEVLEAADAEMFKQKNAFIW